MRKMLLAFGLITLLSGLFSVYFSGGEVTRKVDAEKVYDMWVSPTSWGPDGSRALYLPYKRVVSKKMILDVFLIGPWVNLSIGSSPPVTVKVLYLDQYSEELTFENYSILRFELPPLTGGPILEVHNGLSVSVWIYAILTYEAEVPNHLFYFGLIMTVLGFIELVASIGLRSPPSFVGKTQKPEEVRKEETS